jgi:hypothetical protein
MIFFNPTRGYIFFNTVLLIKHFMSNLNPLRHCLLKMLCSIVLLVMYWSTTFAQSDVVGKVTVGYQGWFAANGDGSPINAWWHWTQNWGQSPSASNNGIKSWPDVRDYTSTYATSWPNLNNGQQARLFSSFNDQTVNVQFQWMQQNGIDCAALQRFNPTGGEGPVRDAITAKVRTAAEATGRKFYIMYDVTNWNNMQSEIKTDWINKMSQYTASSAYARHNGKPVVCIWGFGFDDANHPWSADVCLEVINWFKAQNCYVIGGVPRGWRTGIDGSRQGFSGVYHALNMISPWLIGAVANLNDAEHIYNNNYLPDQADCNANGIAYQPCVLPGDLQLRQRLHGDLMWRMFYNAIRAGCQGIYISMYDEYNEGNQIAKTAENLSQVPAGSNFLPLDEDGTAMSSDYYLRLTGDGGRMLKGQLALTPTRPTPFFVTAGAPVVSSSGTASGTVGAAFTYAITASNNPASYGASGLPAGLSVNTTTGSITGSPSVTGTFNATVTATNASGTGSKAVVITISAPPVQTIPGTIQAENYCAMSGVQLEATGDTGGGQNVGWIDPGDWMDYCVTASTAGNYTINARVASPNTGGQIQLRIGATTLATLNVPNTGGWQTWSTVSTTVSLNAGTQTIRAQVVTGGFNVNWLQFSASVAAPVISSAGTASGTVGSAFSYTITASNNPASFGASGLPTGLSVNTANGVISGTPTASGTFNATVTATNAGGTGSKPVTFSINSSTQTPYPNGTPWPIPGTIEVENFDNGGEGVAFHDNDAINSGGQGRTALGVDTENCSEGGLNIGWTNTGEWYEYTVNVSPGSYNIEVRAASTFSGGTFHIEFNGVDRTGLFTVTNTGGWQTWATISKTGISLSGGQQVMRIYLDNANFNLNRITFSPVIIADPSITVSPASATIAPGSIQQLSAALFPNNTTVLWNSSNTAVATVSTNGLVTGIANGTATISAMRADNAATATSSITVSTATDPPGVITCYRTAGAISVNGNLNESAWIVTRTFSKTIVGSPNNTATFGVLWDNTNLYIGARILDANLHSDSPDPWEDDAVEVYIDANNNKLTTYDGRDNQVIKNYNKSTVFTKFAIAGLQHAWAAVSGGYTIELAIPWSQLGIAAPVQGTTLGFDIGYNDDDNAGGREGQAVWNGTVNNYQNTSAFGSLVLNNGTGARMATEEKEEGSFDVVVIAPNPAVDGYIKILVPGNKGVVPFRIFDIHGKVILEDEIDGSEKIIDVSGRIPGLYFVKVKTRNGLSVKKVIIGR